ncbi:hypothetical protein SporoP37_02440 [Sporosarcina sp. P37]|uniref:hypothetical protein n=1 Tax=unclassified Sporosarcina TaxID=2647733 RepID=UPI000A17E4E5|nr:MULTISPECIES: hypothetical protein [unclassified Sporosarcina]ARK23660.1 hypothetical protein SporoP37_02440 [Sporosarcina sp. P37]PID18715.1 hypothetical protein CSV62_06310 [Sporosarcina sp. P35]
MNKDQKNIIERLKEHEGCTMQFSIDTSQVHIALANYIMNAKVTFEEFKETELSKTQYRIDVQDEYEEIGDLTSYSSFLISKNTTFKEESLYEGDAEIDKFSIRFENGTVIYVDVYDEGDEIDSKVLEGKNVSEESDEGMIGLLLEALKKIQGKNVKVNIGCNSISTEVILGEVNDINVSRRVLSNNEVYEVVVTGSQNDITLGIDELNHFSYKDDDNLLEELLFCCYFEDGMELFFIEI